MERTIQTKFYTFGQNNSGGSFVENDELSCFVIIEAADADQARSRAESVGIYFNGCDEGRDCSCCGDRWSDYALHEPTDAPEVYGTPASEADSMWMDKPVTIHYLDGKVEKTGKPQPKRS